MVHNVSGRIRAARKSAGFTQEALAEAVGVSRTAVAKWENGECLPDIENLITLTEVLSVSADYLLDVRSDGKKTLPVMTDAAASALEKFICEIKKQ